jgi:hypothetical protein
MSNTIIPIAVPLAVGLATLPASAQFFAPASGDRPSLWVTHFSLFFPSLLFTDSNLNHALSLLQPEQPSFARPWKRLVTNFRSLSTEACSHSRHSAQISPCGCRTRLSRSSPMTVDQLIAPAHSPMRGSDGVRDPAILTDNGGDCRLADRVLTLKVYSESIAVARVARFRRRKTRERRSLRDSRRFRRAREIPSKD